MILEYAVNLELLSVSLLETANRLNNKDNEEELLNRMKDPARRKDSHEKILTTAEYFGGKINEDFRCRYTMKGG